VARDSDRVHLGNLGPTGQRGFVKAVAGNPTLDAASGTYQMPLAVTGTAAFYRLRK